MKDGIRLLALANGSLVLSGCSADVGTSNNVTDTNSEKS